MKNTIFAPYFLPKPLGRIKKKLLKNIFMKQNLTEFLGTFFLVFTIGCAAASGSTLAPIAVATLLAALIYAGKAISGAHYNPAVTLSILLCQKIERPEAIIIGQSAPPNKLNVSRFFRPLTKLIS